MGRFFRKLFLFGVLVMGCMCLELYAAESKVFRSVKIGIVADSNAPGLDQMREAFCHEITSLLKDEFTVSFSDKNQFIGDWSIEAIQNAIDLALEDPSIDIVVSIGAMSSNEIAHRPSFPKPTFAPFIMNVELQQPPLVNGASGVYNMNYLTFPTNLKRDIQVFHEMVPFKKLTVLMNGFLFSYVPELSEQLNGFGRQEGIEVEVLPFWDSVDEGIRRLPPDVEAVYVLSLTQLSNEDLKKVADALLERKVPSFTLFSRRYLEGGFLASMSPDSDLPRLIRRLALNVQRALLGENPGDFLVHVSEYDQLAVNMKTARGLGISLPWKFIEEAVLLNEAEKASGIVFSLEDAVRYGLDENPTLAAGRRAVNVGQEEVCKVRSSLLPQVNVKGIYAQIDKDRARGSFGILPERAIWGAASLSQVVYSNEVFGSVRIERYLQSARKHKFCRHRLDTILSVSLAYLNLLRAQTVEETHRNNLERTRSHLKLARQRAYVGATRENEVYRWESQYSNDMSVLTDAHYQAKVAETTLKRILNIPQTERVSVKEVSLDEPYWARKGEWLKENITNDDSLEKFIGFSVVETLHQSERLKELHQEVCSQAEVLGISRRAFWSPDVYIEAMVSDRSKEWGAGTGKKALFNSTDWGVALNVSFPLYTGGYKSAVRRQACQELKRLQLELQALVEEEKEQVRNAVYNAISTHSAIGLSLKAAEFARKNFNLVRDSYSKGVVSIVDMLDAQNASLVADLDTANAVYNFLSDLMIYQHVTGRFDFFLTDQDIQKWVEKIGHYFKEQR